MCALLRDGRKEQAQRRSVAVFDGDAEVREVCYEKAIKSGAETGNLYACCRIIGGECSLLMCRPRGLRKPPITVQ